MSRKKVTYCHEIRGDNPVKSCRRNEKIYRVLNEKKVEPVQMTVKIGHRRNHC